MGHSLPNVVSNLSRIRRNAFWFRWLKAICAALWPQKSPESVADPIDDQAQNAGLSYNDQNCASRGEEISDRPGWFIFGRIWFM